MTSSDEIVSLGGGETWSRATALVKGALRRRWIRVALLAMLFTTVAAVAASLMPRSYSAESRLLVKKNYMMPALASPRRAVPLGSEAPLQSAAEFVLSRQALRGIVERHQLVERWDRERAPLLRMKDRAMERLRGPVPAEEKAEALIDMLAQRIRVMAQDDTIRVSARWPDRATVLDVVNGAVEAFLEARRKFDVQSVADTYEILEGFAARERTRVEQQLSALVQGRSAATRVQPPAFTRAAAPVAMAAARQDDGLDQLRSHIRAARKAAAELARQHADKVAEVESRIAERRTVLTEQHPEIQALRRTLERLASEPDPLIEARRDEARLVSEYLGLGGTEDRLADEQPTAPTVVQQAAAPTSQPAVRTPRREPRRLQPERRGHTRVAVASDVETRRDEAYAVLVSGATDEVTERLALEDLLADAAPASGDEDDDVANYARAVLKNSLESYQDLRARLANVQIELATAQAAFNYRYSITAPARMPKRADSPNVPLMVLGGLLAGLFSGIVGAVFAELRALSLLSPSALARHLGVGGAPSNS